MRHPYQLLILEDHMLQCVHMRDTLLEQGFAQVDMANRGQQALSLLAQRQYDAIVLDLDMPDMDGMQFIQLLSTQHPGMPLAITSAWPARMMESASQMARSRQLVVLGSFPKPFSASAAQALAAALTQAHQRSTAPAPEATATHALPLDAASLGAAIDNGQLSAWFQPKLSLTDARICGAEALVRWQHPRLGVISPGQFLPAISAAGLDLRLLQHVLDDALHAYRLWLHAGYRVPLSVNLASHLLDDTTLPDQLQAQVEALGVPCQDITFELLEDSRTSDPGDFFMGASRLRLKGFGLAQDDFGIGYSSMQTLTSVPYTELKIDRSFVTGAAEDAHGVQAAAIHAAVELGQRLGMCVTAEGVETQTELALVRAAGCHCAQGYWISAAVPRERMTDLLAAGLLATRAG